jgi:hypothetical protein
LFRPAAAPIVLCLFTVHAQPPQGVLARAGDSNTAGASLSIARSGNWIAPPQTFFAPVVYKESRPDGR